jgi:hypothetical protein
MHTTDGRCRDRNETPRLPALPPAPLERDLGQDRHRDPDEPFLAHRVEERLDVGVQYEVHLPAGHPDTEGVERVVRSPPGRNPYENPRKSSDRGRRPLDYFVFQGGYRKRALPTVAGRVDARFHAPPRVAFRIRNGVGTRSSDNADGQLVVAQAIIMRLLRCT